MGTRTRIPHRALINQNADERVILDVRRSVQGRCALVVLIPDRGTRFDQGLYVGERCPPEDGVDEFGALGDESIDVHIFGVLRCVCHG